MGPHATTGAQSLDKLAESSGFRDKLSKRWFCKGNADKLFN
jgi:hypothetical protein